MSREKLTETQKVTEKREAQAPQDSEGGCDRQRHRRIERIRARASYRLFAELHEFLESKPNMADILKKLYDVLDAKRSFGSVRHARYASESLRLVLEDSRRGPERFRGNFRLGDFFGDVSCCYGHKLRLFNIGRCHYVACDTCRTYIFVGANLMSSWRQENKDIWQRNYDRIYGYQFIE